MSLPLADFFFVFFKWGLIKKKNNPDAKCVLSEIPFRANKQPKAFINYGYN